MYFIALLMRGDAFFVCRHNKIKAVKYLLK